MLLNRKKTPQKSVSVGKGSRRNQAERNTTHLNLSYVVALSNFPHISIILSE